MDDKGQIGQINGQQRPNRETHYCIQTAPLQAVPSSSVRRNGASMHVLLFPRGTHTCFQDGSHSQGIGGGQHGGKERHINRTPALTRQADLWGWQPSMHLHSNVTMHSC